MFCLKDTLKGQATRFRHSRAGSQNAHLISPFAKGEKQRGWIPSRWLSRTRPE